MLSNFFLVKVRLTYYFVILLVLFVALKLIVGSIAFDKAALTLFSANSFLYGFYISPIIRGQKARVEALQKLVDTEASAMYTIASYSRRMEPGFKEQIDRHLLAYSQHAAKNRYVGIEKQFDELMSLLISYKGDHKDEYKEIMKAAFSMQYNQSEAKRLLRQKIYRNEWIVMMILFFVTIFFILTIELPDLRFIHFLPPIITTGLAMLIVILIKMSTLNHKKAKNIWLPLQKLSKTHLKQLT